MNSTGPASNGGAEPSVGTLSNSTPKLGLPASIGKVCARPLPSTVGHLDALVATGGEGHLVLTVIIDKKWRSASFATDEVDAAAMWAAEQDGRGLNVFVRSTLLNRPLNSTYERGTGADTGSVVALAVDLDVAGPGHKNGNGDHPLPKTIKAALSIAAGLPQPSMTINTGGGLHLWWLLDEPVTDQPLHLLGEWADGIVAAGAAKGLHVDRPDPARVLRLCGTHRRKPGLPPNLVTLADVAGWPPEGLATRPWCPTGRYGARDLLDALPKPEPTLPPPPPARPRRPGEIGPADAVALLTWSQILEPSGWAFVGMGRMGAEPVELWRRPGDPTSDYSLKALPDGPAVAWSDACGLPVGKGLTKAQVLAELAGTGDLSALARTIRQEARAIR